MGQMPGEAVAQTIYLHIGTQKTGTTTLQAFAAAQRAWLAGQGVLYPQSPGDPSHVRLTVFAADPVRNRDLRRVAGLLDEADFARFRAGFADQLGGEIARAGAARVLLSDELLSARFRRPEEVAALAGLLRPLAARVVVIAYLRRQSDFFLSTYSTAIRSGNDRDLRPPQSENHRYYNYEKMLAMWAEAFGAENLAPRIYDRGRMLGGSVLPDFFAALDVALPPDVPAPPERNRGLDGPTLEFLRLFHRHVPRFVADVPNPARGDIVTALTEVSSGKMQADPAMLRRIDEMFAPSNRAVARRYFGHEGELFPQATYAAEGAERLTLERAVEIAAHLWQYKQRQIEARKARRGASGGQGSDLDPLGP